MYRAAVRPASRRALAGLRRSSMRSVPQRSASTAAPADKPRSWKSSALRWGLAVVAVYYYNTSSVFADETPTPQTIPAPSSFAESDLPTVDAVIEEKRKQLQAQPPEPAERKQGTAAESEKQVKTEAQNPAAMESSPEALEEEAGQEGAFNPETGEINWDCPCLGGMAHGPCGEEFKTAFSCFVYSKEEPKGMDCIDRFQGMQECFRKYPDIYGAELGDDEQPEEDAGGTGQPAADEYQALRDDVSKPAATDNKPETHNLSGVRAVGDPIPKKWEDATAANDEAQRSGDKDRESEPTPAAATKK